MIKMLLERAKISKNKMKKNKKLTRSSATTMNVLIINKVLLNPLKKEMNFKNKTTLKQLKNNLISVRIGLIKSNFIVISKIKNAILNIIITMSMMFHTL